MTVTLTLFDLAELVTVDDQRQTIDERFAAFNHANKWVYDALVTLSRQQRARRPGCRIGIKALVEIVRWEYDRRTDGPAFKINNDFTSRYARLIMAGESDLADAFPNTAAARRVTSDRSFDSPVGPHTAVCWTDSVSDIERLLELLERPAWTAHAACAGMDSTIFYPSSPDPLGHIPAKRVCAACPVRVECADAGSGERHGVWGGMSPKERQRRRRTAA